MTTVDDRCRCSDSSGIIESLDHGAADRTRVAEIMTAPVICVDRHASQSTGTLGE